MNINDYSTKVKNLIDALISIGAPVDDENLVAMTLNRLGKDYSQFRTSIVVRETIPNFQDLITLLISEEIRILVFHPMEDHKKVLFIQIPIKVEVEVVKPHFEVDTEVRMVDIINMKVKLMEVDKETLEEKEIKEVVEVVMEVIEVYNQIVIQIATIVGNPGTWQRTIIKGNMMHEMESYNKGIMHQLAIKVMSNYL